MANEIEFDEEIMYDRMMSILGNLSPFIEAHDTAADTWSSALRQLYLLSMGHYKCVGDPVPPSTAAEEESKQTSDLTNNEESKGDEEQKGDED